jgi:hypothetical protein
VGDLLLISLPSRRILRTYPAVGDARPEGQTARRGGTADGLHWFADGDTENPNTAIDDILAVDDHIVLQEGQPVAGSAMTMAAVFFTRMLPDGTWYCRGDDPADNDWAVRSGVLLAKTGDALSSTEDWGTVISGFTGNLAGDWLVTGQTDNPDLNHDYVMVLNGTRVVAREGDAIDLDRNGAFDDDVYLNTFNPDDLFLTDDRIVWFLATLRGSSGVSRGDAFLWLSLRPGDTDCNGAVDFDDINPFVTALVGQAAYETRYPNCRRLNGDIDGDGDVNSDDINPFVECLVNQGCP